MEGYIAEIRMFAATFAPRNWAYCQGQIISIAQNTALFSLLGTTYGGNGQTTFALPNLASRQARGTGQGAGLSNVQLGETSGFESSTLTINSMPSHNHQVIVSTSASTSGSSPSGQAFSSVNARLSTPGVSATVNTYSGSGGSSGAGNGITLQVTGSSAPFSVMNPYLGMNYIICMYGIFPSRS